MTTILTGAKGVPELAAMLGDRVAALTAVGSALLLGGWLCMAAMTLN